MARRKGFKERSRFRRQGRINENIVSSVDVDDELWAQGMGVSR